MSDEIGQRVLDSDGHAVGRAVELVVHADDPLGRIVRVGIGRGRHVRSWIDWTDVISFEGGAIQLGAGAAQTPDGTEDSGPTDLRLVRDVLDAQVFDSAGNRLVRVGDILLVPVATDLTVAGVQCGAGPVAHRLGARRLATRLPTSTIDWRELHLTSGSGLTAQLETDSHGLDGLTPTQLAAMLAQVSTTHASDVLHAVGPDHAASALSRAHPDVSARVLGGLPHGLAAEVVDRMPSDDAAAMLRGVPEPAADRLLDQLHSERSEELRRLLAAPPDTAGALMSTDVHVAHRGDSLAEIRAELAANPPRIGGLTNVIVVDDDHRPVAMFDTIALVAGDGLPQPVPFIQQDTPVQQVIDLFAVHDFLALPVVDPDGRLVGAIAVDDVLEELVAERLPGRRRFRHGGSRGRLGHRRPRAEPRRTP